MTSMNRRALLGGAATAILGASIFSAAQSALAQSPVTTPEDVFRDPDIPVLGNPDGDVTIVEFFDYQCPFCRRVHPILRDFVAEDGNVRLILKDWPMFGDGSLHAARLMLASAGTPDYEAGQNAVLDTEGRLSVEAVDGYLREAGLDPEAMLARYESKAKEVDATIERNGWQALALRISGTPAFVIGRRVYGGMLDADGFRQAVTDARTQDSAQ